MRVSPQGTEIHAIPPTERAFSLGKPSASSARGKRGALQARLTSTVFRGKHPARAPGSGFPRPQSPDFSPLPSPPHPPNHPAGRTAGSARTRPRDQSLGNPFFGKRRPFSRLPFPQNAAGGKPLLVGLPPSTRTAAPSETKRSAQAPCSWGLGASTRSRRHWPPAPPARRALPAS